MGSKGAYNAFLSAWLHSYGSEIALWHQWDHEDELGGRGHLYQGWFKQASAVRKRCHLDEGEREPVEALLEQRLELDCVSFSWRMSGAPSLSSRSPPRAPRRPGAGPPCDDARCDDQLVPHVVRPTETVRSPLRGSTCTHTRHSLAHATARSRSPGRSRGLGPRCCRSRRPRGAPPLDPVHVRMRGKIDNKLVSLGDYGHYT